MADAGGATATTKQRRDRTEHKRQRRECRRHNYRCRGGAAAIPVEIRLRPLPEVPTVTTQRRREWRSGQRQRRFQRRHCDRRSANASGDRGPRRHGQWSASDASGAGSSILQWNCVRCQRRFSANMAFVSNSDASGATSRTPPWHPSRCQRHWELYQRDQHRRRCERRPAPMLQSGCLPTRAATTATRCRSGDGASATGDGTADVAIGASASATASIPLLSALGRWRLVRTRSARRPSPRWRRGLRRFASARRRTRRGRSELNAGLCPLGGLRRRRPRRGQTGRVFGTVSNTCTMSVLTTGAGGQAQGSPTHLVTSDTSGDLRPAPRPAGPRFSERSRKRVLQLAGSGQPSHHPRQ